MNQSLAEDEGRTNRLSMREYLVMKYLEENAGQATRQELKIHLFQVAGYSSIQRSIVSLEKRGLIVRPRPGVYTLPDFKPKPLGQKQNP